MSDKKFELVDRSSERKSQLPVRNGTIGPSVVDIGTVQKDLGVFTYDPGFGMTASTESRITYIDGDAGQLLYRGFPVEQLAEKSSFMECAYLLLLGELPNRKQLNTLRTELGRAAALPAHVISLLKELPKQTQPMDALRQE